MLDGVGTAAQYAERAAHLGQPALALTDHGNMCGALHHIRACAGKDSKGAKIHEAILPIVGVEAYFKPDRGLKDKENKENWHMVLLARNMVGFRNLLRLTSEGYTSGFYHKPCVDWELLHKYGEGLYALTACFKGFYPSVLREGTDRNASNCLDRLASVFNGNLAVEIMPHDFDSQRELNIALINAANAKGIPYVATVDAHYPYQDWADTQDVVLMLATGQSLDKRSAKREAGEDVYQFDCDTLWLMSDVELEYTFAQYHPDISIEIVQRAIANTESIVSDNFGFYVIDRATKLPKTNAVEDSKVTIARWCQEGLERIGKPDEVEYMLRLQTEMKVLTDKGVLDYFVLVGDMVRWAKKQGIKVGAGRGSAAGCLVSYLIGITGIDPIAYGLMFERFLNPDRKGMPDIDIDFQDDRRDEVKGYLAEKWGEDHVSNIVSFSTFQPKAALQDVSRVLSVPYEETRKMLNAIDLKPTDDSSLEDIRLSNQEVDAFAQLHPEVWRHAARLEGQIRNVSQHAAGVVITPGPVQDYMPVMRAKDGAGTVTAWSDSANFPIISDYGFVKIDVLSTDGLTKQQHAMDMVFERTGERIDLDDLEVTRNPYAVEERVMKAFTMGLTLGVFQFGSRGITQLLRQIEPATALDISAANALYRPGPLSEGVHAQYARRKNGREPVDYWHESVEPILKESFGLLIYQEQVMAICHELGGLTLAESDDMRKAIGKLYRQGPAKVREYMSQHFEKFAAGCRAHGLKDPMIDDIWEKIVAFGGYGFNKSHSASYGVQAYQDMWIKVHYPMEFYAAMLSHLPANPQKALIVRKESVREARVAGIEILPPDVNESGRGFAVVGTAIRYGLGAVKYLGDSGVQEILEKRPFVSYDDFEERITKKKCNKRAKQALLSVGALDGFGMRTGWTRQEIVDAERENLGVSLTATRILNTKRKEILSVIYTPEEIENMNVGEGVLIAGEFVSIKRIRTRKGDPMAFAYIAFGTYSWETTIFTSTYEEYHDYLEEGAPIVVKCRIDNQHKLVADEFYTVEHMIEQLGQTDG